MADSPLTEPLRRNRFARYPKTTLLVTVVVILALIELASYVVIVVKGHRDLRFQYRYNRILSGYTVFQNVPNHSFRTSAIKSSPAEPGSGPRRIRFSLGRAGEPREAQRDVPHLSRRRFDGIRSRAERGLPRRSFLSRRSLRLSREHCRAAQSDSRAAEPSHTLRGDQCGRFRAADPPIVPAIPGEPLRVPARPDHQPGRDERRLQHRLGHSLRRRRRAASVLCQAVRTAPVDPELLRHVLRAFHGLRKVDQSPPLRRAGPDRPSPPPGQGTRSTSHASRRTARLGQL